MHPKCAAALCRGDAINVVAIVSFLFVPYSEFVLCVCTRKAGAEIDQKYQTKIFLPFLLVWRVRITFERLIIIFFRASLRKVKN